MTLSSVRSTALRLILPMVCLVASAAGYAAVNDPGALTSSKVFAEIPLDVLDMLRPSSRLDMLDYYSQADSLISVADALGGSSRLELVTPDYLKLAVTPVSTLEIKILPYGKKQLVMTLYTVGGDGMAKDTRVRFFDSSLQPLDTGKFLKAPKLEDFFNIKGSGISEADLAEKIPFAAVVYTSGPGEVPLTATLTSLEVLPEEDRAVLLPLLTPLLASDWKNRFRF